MKKTMTFAGRCAKEILRDPITLFFGLAFPVVLLLLMQQIDRNVPASPFSIETLAPGMAVFGLSFLSLFSAMLISRDRESAFLMRLYTTPLTATGYLVGYTLPLLPFAMAQGAVVYLTALCVGLTPDAGVLLAWLLLLPAALFFIALGLLCGSLLRDKQVGGMVGGVLPSATAWLSGAWFDPALVGGFYQTLCSDLPFLPAARLGAFAIGGDFTMFGRSLVVLLVWTLLVAVLAVWVFLRQMQKD